MLRKRVVSGRVQEHNQPDPAFSSYRSAQLYSRCHAANEKIGVVWNFDGDKDGFPSQRWTSPGKESTEGRRAADESIHWGGKEWRRGEKISTHGRLRCADAPPCMQMEIISLSNFTPRARIVVTSPPPTVFEPRVASEKVPTPIEVWVLTILLL